MSARPLPAVFFPKLHPRLGKAARRMQQFGNLPNHRESRPVPPTAPPPIIAMGIATRPVTMRTSGFSTLTSRRPRIPPPRASRGRVTEALLAHETGIRVGLVHHLR